MTARLAPALLLLALGPAALEAQGPKAAATVRIDFRALSDDGQPVSDLKPDEVTLKVNGKPRALKALNLFRATDTAAPAGTALPPPYSTNNVGQSGRVIHVLIDDDSISPGREGQVKEAIRLLTSELSPGDRIGVLTPHGQVNIRPGDDIGKVRLAVDGLAGKASPSEVEADTQCRTTRLLAALSTMIGITGGTPTTIVVFSGGISPPATKMVQVGRTNRTAIGGREADPSSVNDTCPVLPEDFENIGVLAATAHADLYLFHLTEALANRSTQLDAGFESLAGVTGAEFLRIPANPQPAMTRLLRETATYYTVTFEPEAGERNGQAFRVDLKSTRDKVKLRSRPSVQMPKEVASKNAASPKDMLRVQTEYRDLPLRATAYTSRMPGSEELRVTAIFEGLDGAALSAASVGLFDEKNTLKKQWTAQKEDLGRRPVRADLQASPGVYRVRVAAVDSAGRSGTADYDLKAEVVRADPLKLSALVLGTQQQGAGFVPRLEFTNEQIAIGLLEIYGVPKGGNLTVDLEVAQSAQGEALATAQTQLGNGQSEDARLAMGGFSIASLAPGDYLMRATVSLDGKPVGRVVRTLRKSQ